MEEKDRIMTKLQAQVS